MYIITDVFAHHVFHRSSFFIISFSLTSIHHIVSHYHICFFGHSVALNFVSLVSSGPYVAAQLDSVLVLVFTPLCVATWLFCELVWIFVAFQFTLWLLWLSLFLFNYTSPILFWC